MIILIRVMDVDDLAAPADACPHGEVRPEECADCLLSPDRQALYWEYRARMIAAHRAQRAQS